MINSRWVRNLESKYKNTNNLNYPDYFARASVELAATEKENELVAYSSLNHRYWIKIAENIQEEKPTWVKFMKGDKSLEDGKLVLTHLCVSHALQCTTFDMDENLELIKQYGERNKMLLARLMDYISAGKLLDLRQKLSNDLCYIQAVIPQTEKFTQNLLDTLINSIIDRWFTRNDKDPNEFQLWESKPELLDLDKKASTSQNDPADLEEELGTHVIAALQKRVHQ